MRRTAPISRRTFVQAMPAAAALAPAILASGQSLPSNRVRIGLIGCGGRGRELLNVFRQFPDVDVPVISSHRINDPKTARELIADGMCDMVAMGRSLIADPYLPEKAKAGKESEIVHCVACAQGCFDNLFKLKHITRFLEEKNKVKVVMRFRGREIIHMDKGLEMLIRVRDDVADKAIVETEPRAEGRTMIMMLAPK